MAYIFKENATTCLLAGEKFAIWLKPESGDEFGPYKAPLEHMDLVLFHSDLDYYGVAAYDLAKVVTHASIAGKTTNVGGVGGSPVAFEGQFVTRTHTLITHNLGYVPKFFVVSGGQMIPTGIPIQDAGVGKKRFVSAYATDTEIRLYEVGYSSSTSLPATSVTYQVFVFRDSAPDALLPIMKLSPSEVIFGKGKFRSDDPHLRAYDTGDSALAIALDRSAAVRNGGLRAYIANGEYVDFQNFNGSLPAPTFVNLAMGV